MFSRHFLSLLIRTCQILASFPLKHSLVILKHALMYVAYGKSQSKTSLKALTLIKLMFCQHRHPAFLPSCSFISCLWRGCHLMHVASAVAVSHADTSLQQGRLQGCPVLGQALWGAGVCWMWQAFFAWLTSGSASHPRCPGAFV